MDEAHREPGIDGFVRHYLKNVIFGANDGVITTLAVVSGVVGASLSTRVILILGFAKLVADGFSMGASDFLSSRSEPSVEDRPAHREATRHAAATFVGFVLAGFVPLVAYLIPGIDARFRLSLALTLAALFGIGAGRALFSDRRWLRAGLEMLGVGLAAAGVAYGVGALAAHLTGGGI